MMCFSSRRWSLRDKDRFCLTVSCHKRDVWSLIRLWSIWNINHCNIISATSEDTPKVTDLKFEVDQRSARKCSQQVHLRTWCLHCILRQAPSPRKLSNMTSRLQDLVVLLHLFFCGLRALMFFGYISQSMAEMVWVMYYNKVYHKGLWFPIANFGQL